MKTDGIENLVDVLSNYIENAADNGTKWQLESAEKAVGELSRLTNGAICWDDFLSDEEEEDAT